MASGGKILARSVGMLASSSTTRAGSSDLIDANEMAP